MKLQKIVFGFLVAVHGNNFTMDNEGSEFDSRKAIVTKTSKPKKCALACQAYLSVVDIYSAHNPEVSLFRAADEVKNKKQKLELENVAAIIPYPFITIEGIQVEHHVNAKSGNLGIADVAKVQEFFVLQSVAKMLEHEPYVSGSISRSYDVLKASMVPNSFVGACSVGIKKAAL
jgi:hypothetical protein